MISSICSPFCERMALFSSSSSSSRSRSLVPSDRSFAHGHSPHVSVEAIVNLISALSIVNRRGSDTQRDREREKHACARSPSLNEGFNDSARSVR